MQCIKCKREVIDAPYCCQCGAKQEQVKRGHRRGNGEGTVYKDGDTWTAQAVGTSYTDKDGRLVRHRPKKRGFKTKKEALEWAMSQGTASAPQIPTLLDLWQGWSDNDMLTLSKDKIAGYRKARERIETIITRQIDTLTLDELQAVVNEQATSYYTARDVKFLLSHLYQRAMMGGGASGKITVNIARYIVLPPLAEKEPEPFSAEEVAKLWQSWEDGVGFVGYMLLMIYSSMMPGELLACKKSMIDFERHEIYGCGKKTKKRKDTPIVFPEFLTPVLEELCNATEGDMLFSGGDDTFYRKFKLTEREVGIRELPPYACRHTTATEAVKMGVELPVVQQIMRHAKLSSTQRYIHVSTDAAHAGINALKK